MPTNFRYVHPWSHVTHRGDSPIAATLWSACQVWWSCTFSFTKAPRCLKLLIPASNTIGGWGITVELSPECPLNWNNWFMLHKLQHTKRFPLRSRHYLCVTSQTESEERSGIAHEQKTWNPAVSFHVGNLLLHAFSKPWCQIENVPIILIHTVYTTLPFPSSCTKDGFESKSVRLESRRFSVLECIQHRPVFPRPALCDILPTLFILWRHWCNYCRVSTTYRKRWIPNTKYF